MDLEKLAAILNTINEKLNLPAISVKDLAEKLNNNNDPEVQSYRKFKETHDWILSKRALKGKYSLDNSNPFARVFHFYLEDETDEQAAERNKEFINRISKPEGFIELFNKELNKIAHLDPSILFMTDEDKMLDFYKNDPALCELMAVINGPFSSFTSAKVTIPKETLDFFKRVKTAAEATAIMKNTIGAKGSPFYLYFHDTDVAKIVDFQQAADSAKQLAEDKNSPELEMLALFTESYLYYGSQYDLKTRTNGAKMTADGRFPKDFRHFRVFDGDKEINYSKAADPKSKNVRFEELPGNEKDALDKQLENLIPLTEAKKYAKAEEKAEENVKAFDIANAGTSKLMDRVGKLIDTQNLTNGHYALPETIEENKNVQTFGLRVDRSAIPTLAMGRMLLKGYKINDILDPSKLAKERAAAGKEVMDTYNRGGDSLGKYAAEGYLAVVKEITDYVNSNVPGNLSTEQLIALPQFRNLLSMGRVLQDAGQELERVRAFANDLKNMSAEKIDGYLRSQVAASFMIVQYDNLLNSAHAMYTGKIKGADIKVMSATQDMLAKAIPAAKLIVQNADNNKPFTDYQNYQKAQIQVTTDGPSYIMNDTLRVSHMLYDKTNRHNIALSILGSRGQKNMFQRMGEALSEPDYENAVKPIGKQTAVSDSFIENNVNVMRRSVFLEKVGRSFWSLPKELSPAIDSKNRSAMKDERSMLTTLAFCDLVEEGKYSIDQILDPRNEDIRKAAAERSLGRYNTALEDKDGDAFNQYVADKYAAGLRKCIDYINEKTVNSLEFNDIFRPDMKNFMTVRQFMGEAAQVLDKNLHDYTNGIPDIKELLNEELSLDAALIPHKNVMEAAMYILDPARTEDEAVKAALDKLLPALAATKYTGDLIKNMPIGKKLSELTKTEANKFNLVFSAAKAQLSDKDDEISDLLDTPEGRHKFIYTVLNGQAGSKLFKVIPGAAVTRENTKNEFNKSVTIFHSNIRIADLEKLKDIKVIKKNFAPDEAIPEIARPKQTRVIEHAMEDILLKAAAEHFPDKAKAISNAFDPEDIPELTKKLMESFFHNNLAGSAGKVYNEKTGKKDPDPIDEMTKDLLGGKEVYVVRPDGKYYQITINANDKLPKLSDEPVQTLGQTEINKLANKLEEYRKTMEDTTLNDSSQFDELRKAYANTINTLRSSKVVNSKTVLKDLRNAADKYYFAKLDQDQNERRSKRFDAADELRRMGNWPEKADRKVVKYNIAAKAIKSYAKLLSKSKNEDSVSLGAELLKNGKAFRNAVNNLTSDAKFDEYCPGTMQDLKQLFKRSGDTMAKDLFAANGLKIDIKEPKPAEVIDDKKTEAPVKD